MKSTLKISAIVLLSFLAYFLIRHYFEFIYGVLNDNLHNKAISYFLTAVINGIPLLIGTAIIHKGTDIFLFLGLTGNIMRGILFPLFCTLPMFLGGVFFFPCAHEDSISRILILSFFAGFFEELWYRGFLFGQVYRFTRAGFIPAVLLSAVVFAYGHLYQGSTLLESTEVFLVTFSGAVFFAWLFTEWNYNLWVPVFIHSFMNLTWVLFKVSDTAAGNVTANIFRGITIALAIIITIYYKKRKGEELVVRKPVLIWRKSEI